MLAAAAGMNGAQIIDACRRVDDLPAALAAIDLALWDRAGRRAGKPVAALLDGQPARRGAGQRDARRRSTAPGVAEQAARAVREGFACLKVKVGSRRRRRPRGRGARRRRPAGRAAPGRQRRVERGGGGARDRGARPGRPRAGRGARARPAGGARGARAGGGARRDRRDRGRARRARRGRRRRGLPEDLPLRRHLRPARRRHARARLRRRGRTSPRRSTARSGIAAALHAAAALASRGPLPHCGLATLGLFEGPRGPAAGARRADRRADAAPGSGSSRC